MEVISIGEHVRQTAYGECIQCMQSPAHERKSRSHSCNVLQVYTDAGSVFTLVS